MEDPGWIEIPHAEQSAELAIVHAGGDWTIVSAGSLDRELQALALPAGREVVFDLHALRALDTAGAWLIYRTVSALRARRHKVRMRGGRERHRAMLRRVGASYRPCTIEPPRLATWRRLALQVGAATVGVARDAGGFVAFLGAAVLALLRTLARPRRLRITSLVNQMEQVGFNALPIVALMSFLVGVVLAYQGAAQLQRLGAEVFVVDLIAVSVLREIGILLTAVVVAGRSGSAFTAQIGAMKANEEVDAMRTLGLDPLDVLVLPRLLALILTLPILAFVADLMGLLGGGLMAWAVLDISPWLFLQRLREGVEIGSFWVGIAKAPFFAAVIALVGCYEGLQVSGSAESVGRQTTRAVVEAIFLVIVIDAMFSIFFDLVGV